MPIRFRCVYCNQLLSIARRKAGAIVRCTKCEGQIIVPDPSPSATELAGDEPSQPRSGMTKSSNSGSPFEREDFEALLEPYQKPAMPAAVADEPSPSAHRGHLMLNSAAPSPAPVPSAITVTRRQLAIAFALTVLGLGATFALGLWLGQSMG